MNTGKMLRQLPQSLGLALLASVLVVVSAAFQTMELLQIGFIGFVLLAWVAILLIFGISLRSTLMFCALLLVKPLPTTFAIALVIIPLSLVLEYIQSGRQALSIPHPIALAILLASAIYGLVRARDLGDAGIYFLSTAVVPVILLVLTANSRIEKTDLLVWMRFVVWVGTLLGVVGIFMGILSPDERYGSLWITAMTINGFYTLAFFFAIALGVRETTAKPRYLWYLCALLIFLGMMYTYTRIALVAVFAGFLLLMLKMKKMRYVGLAVLLVTPLVIPSSMLSRIQMSFSLDISIVIRLFAWYNALKEIFLHPLFGQGISVWKEWYMGVIPVDILYAEHPHNLFLKIWLDLGIFGFLAYFYLIWAVLRRFYRRLVKRAEDNFNRIVLIGVVALLISCLTDIFIQQYPVSLAFWATLGLMYAQSKPSEQTEVT